jgi:glutaredoxin-like YruB-family protein
MAEKPKVKVYSTPFCPWCVKAKDFLKEHDVEFEEIDVSQDHDAAHHMIEKSGQSGVPVIEIDGKFVVGFDRARIVELLDIKE